MNVKGEMKGDVLCLFIDTTVKPSVSKAEAEKAAKAGRQPEAKMIATTGGFIQFGGVKVSLNAMLG